MAPDGDAPESAALSSLHSLTAREILFVQDRDFFYLAAVDERGRPYLNHVHGPTGFVEAPVSSALICRGFALPAAGSAVRTPALGDHVQLMFVDYPRRRALTVSGSVADVPRRAVPTSPHDLESRQAEPCLAIEIASFEWADRPLAKPRYTPLELAPLTGRIAAVEAENAVLKARLAARRRPDDGDSGD